MTVKAITAVFLQFSTCCVFVNEKRFLINESYFSLPHRHPEVIMVQNDMYRLS